MVAVLVKILRYILYGLITVMTGPHTELLHTTFIAPLGTLIEDFKPFCSLVENTIDLEQAESLHEYIIRPSFSSRLQELHKEKNLILEGLISSLVLR